MKALYLRTQYSLDLKAGGSVAHTRGVLRALDRQVSLDVVANDPLGDVLPGIRVVEPILRGLPVINELLYNFKVILALRHVEDFDFIYHRYSGLSFCAAWLARKRGIPLILEFNSFDTWRLLHWSHGYGRFNRWFRRNIQVRFVSWIERYNLRTAVLVVAVSKALEPPLKALGVEEPRILVNPNAVEPGDFDMVSEDEIDSLRDRYQLRDKVVLGFIGIFSPWHGLDVLIRAINLYFDQHGDPDDRIRFLLIGDGPMMPQVRDMLERSRWQQKVVLTGLVPQACAPAYLKACDILLSPHVPNPDGSEFFGSPTKLFEYMACEVPVIASDLGQIGELLRHGETGWLVEPGNAEAVARASHHLLQNPRLCTRLAKNASREVRQKHTWDQHVSKILARFAQL